MLETSAAATVPPTLTLVDVSDAPAPVAVVAIVAILRFVTGTVLFDELSVKESSVCVPAGAAVLKFLVVVYEVSFARASRAFTCQ
jgi:hypothetical protein